MYEPITPERLNDYGEVSREYEFLLKQKNWIIQEIGIIQGIDYSKTKVTNTNNKTSAQEIYILKLEKINNKINEYQKWLLPEKEIIKNQIRRIGKWHYRKILVLRYIERWKWSEIIEDFFCCEEDFEKCKNDKYREKIMYWNRQALCELDRVSSKP